MQSGTGWDGTGVTGITKKKGWRRGGGSGDVLEGVCFKGLALFTKDRGQRGVVPFPTVTVQRHKPARA